MSRARRDRTSSEALAFFLSLFLFLSSLIHIISYPLRLCFFFFARSTNSPDIPYQSRRITKFDIDYNNNNTLTTYSASYTHAFFPLAFPRHSFAYNSQVLPREMLYIHDAGVFFFYYRCRRHMLERAQSSSRRRQHLSPYFSPSFRIFNIFI